jgi:MGT family glycosyltransferase
MSRFLFVMPPLVGHVNPAVGVARELVARGHRVAWAGDPVTLNPLLPLGSVAYPCAGPTTLPRPPLARGFAALKHLWEGLLVPLAEAMVPGVEAAVTAFRPDVVVADQQAIAGALVAEHQDLPWVTSATTSAELTDPLAGMPKVRDWLTNLLDGLRARFGNASATADLRFSPSLVLAFTTPALLGEPALVLPQVRYVGPVLSSDHGNLIFPPLPETSVRPLVYVSLGTVNVGAGQRFLRAAVEALRDRPDLRAVVVDPGWIIRDVPERILVRSHVDQLAILAHTNAVVCHAGHNTVCEALYHGIPLVVAPIRDDQPIVADQVTRAGAGVRLRFDRADVDRIGAAIDTVLTDRSYADGAHRISESFRAAGGACAAADLLAVTAQGRSVLLA